MGDRFDILYRFSTDGGSTWVDLTPQVDSQQTVLTHNLCTNNFTSAKDEATFVMPETPLFEPDGVTPTPKKKLIDALLGNSDILIHINAPFPTQKVVWDDNAVVWNGMHVCWSDSGRRFTGYADRSAIDIRSFPLPPKLTIKVQDVSVLHLDDKVDMHICWESYTVKTIVRNLLTLAGYDASHVSLSEADTTVMSATDNITLPFVVDKDKAKTYRQYIDLLLFEAGGYVIDFTEDGHVELVHLAWDGTTPAVRTIDNPMNAEGVQMRGAWFKEDGAKVTWSSLMWSAQEQLWMSDIDQSIESGILVGDTVKPNRYWPDGGELNPQYFEYDAKLLDSAYRTRESRRQNEDLTIIMAKNINIRQDSMQGTTPFTSWDMVDPTVWPAGDNWKDKYGIPSNPALWATKAWVLLHNNTAEDINLTFFTIYGDVLYRYKLNTMETQGAKNPKEYESTYIYDEAQAERFVQFYWHFLQTSRYQFTWSEPCKWNELNEVVAVGIKGNGSTQKALIASKKSKWINGKTEVLTYTAIGVDTYTPATLVPTVIVPSTAKQTPIRPSLTATFASTPSYTLSQWEAYGTPSAPQTWTVTNASSFKPGYIALIIGQISDLDDTPVTLYMDVTEVDTVNGKISGTGIRIDYTVPVNVDNWDFEMEASSAVRNDRLAPYSSLDPNSFTDVQLTSLQKGYGVLEYWSCTGTHTFFGGNPGIQTTTGSAPILRIAKDETDPEITVTMHSLDNSLSIERKITIINETEYDHDFGAWEPDGVYQLPDHYTVNGIDYNILDGDFFVAKSNFTVGGDTYTQGVPYMYGIPNAYSWHNPIAATADNKDRLLRSLGSILNSGVAVPSATALYGWFANLVVQDGIIDNLTSNNAFIQKLFAQAITIMSPGGYIIGGTRYSSAGVIQNWNADGFWFGSDGRLMAQLQSDDVSNTFVGTKVSGATNNVGEGNTAMGYKAMYNNTTGCKYNTAIGYEAMYTDAGSQFNVAIGYMALYSATTNGNNNVGIGYKALYKDSTGYDNVAIGYQTMYNNTTGRENVAIGTNALNQNTTGSHNVAIGYTALLYNTTGWRNIAIGASALDAHTSGNDDIAIGAGALTYETTGYQNVAIGTNSQNSVTTGRSNSSVGYSSLSNVTTGGYNVGIGYDALDGLTTGSHNIGLGYKSAPYSVSGSRQININDALICLEFKAGRTHNQVYTALKAYFANVGDKASCIGIIDGDYPSRIESADSSTIRVIGYSYHDFTAYSSNTLTKRMVLFFANPKLSSNTDADCIG